MQSSLSLGGTRRRGLHFHLLGVPSGSPGFCDLCADIDIRVRLYSYGRLCESPRQLCPFNQIHCSIVGAVLSIGAPSRWILLKILT